MTASFFSRFLSLLLVGVLLLFSSGFAQKASFNFASNVFIQEWLVCGPFPYEKNQNIDTDFLAEHGGESQITPAVGVIHQSSAVPEGRVQWQVVQGDASGKLDFVKFLTPNQKNVVYAAAIIECKEPKRAFLKMGSNDRLKVWLNGEMIHFFAKARSGSPDADQIPVELHKGKNLLLAKVDQEGGGWYLYARFDELNAVDDQLFVSSPAISNVPRRISDNQVADIFSVLLLNSSDKPLGPVELTVLAGKGREKCETKLEKLDPGKKQWITLDSPVDLAKAGNQLTATLVVATAKNQRKLQIQTERAPLADGIVYIVPGFHVDPVWRDSQSGYQVLSFSNLSQNLRAMEGDPDYQTYFHEIPYLKPYYDEFPRQRALMRQLVKEGRIATGGSYNQPNETTVSGEGIIRNILYGRLFHENVLGDYPRAYTPWDVFGHIIQMPQILSKSEFIGTTWTRSNYRGPSVRVPDHPDVFCGVAPDGSKLMTRKVDYGYSWESGGLDVSLGARMKLAADFAEQQKQVPGLKLDFKLDATDEKSPTTWLIGRCNEFKSFIPEVRLRANGTALYLDSLATQAKRENLDIPEVSRDLSQYNEGCELSRFDLKFGNRLGENTLISAEKFATIANLLGAPYPAADLDKAWRQLLYGQHHDGITGCGADVPYLDLAAGYHEALELGARSLDAALRFLSDRIDTRGAKGTPVVVFNPLNWERDDVVLVNLTFEKPVTGFKISNDRDETIEFAIENLQKKAGKIEAAQVTFLARNIPWLGYRVFWVNAADSKLNLPGLAESKNPVVENQFYKITLDPTRGGGIASLVEKSSGREFINQASDHPGNELILLKEGDGFEPAWRFITTGEKRFSKDTPGTVETIETPVYQRIRVTGEMEHAKKRVQEITLYHNLARIDFRTYLVNYSGLQGKNITENDKHDDRDFFLIGFPANLNGAVPVYEDRFATKTYFHSKEYLSFNSTSTEWTSHHAMNSCNQWLDYSYSVRVLFGDAGEIALGPTEILTPRNEKLRQAGFRLQEALVKRGVTATPGYDKIERGYDIQYRRFSFSIGPEKANQYNEKLLGKLDTATRRVFEERLAQNGFAYLLVHDSEIDGAWFDLPVLLVVGKDENLTEKAVEQLTAQLTNGADIQLPAAAWASSKKLSVPDFGLALLNRGNMPVSIEPEGTMVIALMHTVPWQSPLLDWVHDFPEQKTHVFDYALLPHAKNWRNADLVRAGYAFNNPLIARVTTSHVGELPATHSFFSTSGNSAVLSALKPKSNGNEAFKQNVNTDARNGIILRVYETLGETGQVEINSSFDLKHVSQVNLVERHGLALPNSKNQFSLTLNPNSIETLLLEATAASAEKLQPAAKSKTPIYGKFWQHNEGAAPLGYLPVTVQICGEVKYPTAAGGHEVVQKITVAVCNDYTDAPVSGILKIETPPGLRAVPAELPYSVAANSESFYPVAIVAGENTTATGFIRAAIEHEGQTIFDVLEYGLPAKKFGHNQETRQPGERLEWQVAFLNNQVEVTLQNPFSQAVDGQVQLIGPAETWGMPEVNSAALLTFSPWRQNFNVPAKGRLTLIFKVQDLGKISPEDVAFWAVAKLSYFGFVDYKQAIGDLAIKTD